MKIKEVTSEYILFDDGQIITFDHFQECCECNYAEFEDLDKDALDFEFKKDLDFEAVDNAGFRFGNKGVIMYFVPCYSEQNGYYTTMIDIYLNGKKVLPDLFCKEQVYTVEDTEYY